MEGGKPHGRSHKVAIRETYIRPYTLGYALFGNPYIQDSKRDGAGQATCGIL